MKTDQKGKKAEKKQKLVLRKESIKKLDDRELAFVIGGEEPPDMGAPHPIPKMM